MIGEKHEGSDIQNEKQFAGKDISDRGMENQNSGTVTSPLGIFRQNIFV